VPLGLVQGEFTFEHGLDDVLVAGTVEGRVATEKDIQDDAAAPQIAHVIVAFLKHLGSYIIWRSVLLIHLLAAFVHTRCAKVNDGDSWMLAILVQEKILGLQVSMDDFATVAVVDRGKDLLDDVGCILLAEVLLRCDSFEKLTTIAKFSDKKVAFVVLEELIEFQNVRVVHLLQYANLRKQFLLLLFF